MKSSHYFGIDPFASYVSTGTTQQVAQRRRSTAAMRKPLRERGHDHRQSLTPAMRRALRVLHIDGEAVRQTKFWYTERERLIGTETIIALFDRYLVKVVVENHHRRRQIAALTEIGEMVAFGLMRAELEAEMEDATEVYAEAAE